MPPSGAPRPNHGRGWRGKREGMIAVTDRHRRFRPDLLSLISILNCEALTMAFPKDKKQILSNMEAVTYRCLIFCLGMLWLILWYLWPLDHVKGAMTYTTLGQYFSVLYFFFYFLIDIYIFVLAVVNVLLYLCCIDITVISNAFELLGFCFTFCLEIWIINILSSLECGIIVLSSVPHGDCGFSDYPLSVFPIIFLPFQNSCFVENTRKALAHYGPDSNLCIWLLTLLKLITVIWKLDHDGMCITDSEQINKKLCRIFEDRKSTRLNSSHL